MHERAGHEAIAAFLRIDRIGAAGGFVIVTVAAIALGEPLLWLPAATIALLVALLTLALRRLARGQVIASLVLAIAGNWMAALSVTVALPQMWPVMIITLLVPVVLSTPHVDDRQLVVVVAGAVVVVIAATVLGLLNDDGGALPDLDDGLELALIIGALIAHVIPSALIVWHNNRIQAEALNQLEASGEALAESRQRVVEAADGERRRLERDLHDGAQQHLVALGVRLRLLEDRVGPDHELHGDITTLIDASDEAVEELRRLAHGIYPPLLESSGLPRALDAAARQSGLAITTEIDDLERMDPTIERALYFVALEGLSNMAKHAPGANGVLRLQADADRIRLEVCDNGPGFEAGAIDGSHGTTNMDDRLAVIGGELLIESSPGEGTTVIAVAPHRGAPVG